MTDQTRPGSRSAADCITCGSPCRIHVYPVMSPDGRVRDIPDPHGLPTYFCQAGPFCGAECSMKWVEKNGR